MKHFSISMVLIIFCSCNEVRNKSSNIDSAPIKSQLIDSTIEYNLTEEQIDSLINRINQDSLLQKKVEKEIWGESTQGGELTAMFQNKELKKIIVTLYGEMGRSEFSYYVFNTKLIFAFVKREFYKASIYDTTFVPATIERIDSSKYYFNSIDQEEILKLFNKCQKLIQQ